MPTIGPNIGLSVASGVTDLRIDPHQSHSFVIEIANLIVGGFWEVSGLQVESEVYEYREGGRNEHVHRFVGATRHPPLTLIQGLSPLDGLWAWHQDVAAGILERRNGTIYLVDAQLNRLVWWNFEKALPVKWTGPVLNAQEAAVAFAAVELAHNGLSQPRFAGALAGNVGELAVRARLRDELF